MANQLTDVQLNTRQSTNKINAGELSAFWQRQLVGAPNRINIYADHSMPTDKAAQFAALPFYVSKQTIEGLSSIGLQNTSNLELVFFAAFKVLLYRHTFQTDMVVGYVNDANIVNKQVTVNQLLPVRTIIDENQPFADFLHHLQKALDEALEHKGALPNFLSSTAASANIDRILFDQVVYHFKKTTDNFIQNDAAPVAELASTLNPATTELCCILSQNSEGINGIIYYNCALFDAETISNIAKRYQVLLDAIVSNPGDQISLINILPPAELTTLLFDWNNTATDFPHKCIHELFEEQAALTPDAVAVEMYDSRNSAFINKKQLTYAELNQKANKTAHYLQSLGVTTETVVGIYMKRSLEMAIALLGILKAGAAYLPLDPAYPKERLDYILKDSGVGILFSQYRLITKLPALQVKVICPDAEWNTINTYSDSKPATSVTPQNICYIIYTSGSTGMPKGTLILHSGVVNYLHWCIKAYRVKEGSGSPINSSLAFDATVTSFLSPLLAGKKVLLLPEEGEIEALVDALERQNNFSVIKITPAHVEILGSLLSAENSEKQTQALVIGGEALTGKSLGFWRNYAPSTRLINEYGPTETVVGCCIYDIPAIKSLLEDIPIGRPIANTQMYILDNQLQPVPIGVPGEIYIGGEGLARGYLNRAELTAERFITNPFGGSKSARLYKTGDIARYLKDGNILFLGRGDKQVKIRGYRIELGEIEYAIQKTGEAAQAVVIAKDDKDEGKRLVAYYVPKKQQVKTREKELQQQWVANWKDIYEAEYSQTEDDAGVDPEFNLIGWNDSFTGAPMPAAHMKQWLNDIVETVLQGKPQRVLEIGCDTGLIYFQLAGKVSKYIGFDLSESSIKQIKNRISKKSREYGNTELYTAPAHLVTLTEAEQVDTILLNSMVQYFPGEGYLNEVMERCMLMIGNKGRIIVGDVRDLRMLEFFKAQLRLQKAANNITTKEFTTGLEQDVLKEEELCLSPAYFLRLKQLYPQITHIEIRWKNGDFENELSLYRYTAIIYVGIQKPTAAVNWLKWNNIEVKNNTLFDGANEIVGVTDVPNPRLWKDELLKKGLEDILTQTVGDLKHLLESNQKDPGKFSALVNEAKLRGYTPRLFAHIDPLKINVVFEHGASDYFVPLPVEENFTKEEVVANTPLMSDIVLLMQKHIRKQLHDTLPKYMVPADFVAISRIPLTTNGKVDYAALPAPGSQRAENTKAFVAGRNKLETDLVSLFGNVLGMQKLSIQDNLFELGLNSMQAYRVFAQIKKLTGKQLPLSILIEAPSVEKLSDYLNGKQASLPWLSLVAIQPKGTRPPLYLIHAGAGTVLFYRELSLHLGDDQPVYGLQPVGLDGKKPFHKSVEEMANHYVKEIRAVNPNGPYLLGGYCFGAILAFEMARQLIADNKVVTLLCNFNGASPVYNENANGHTALENEEEAGLVPMDVQTIKKVATLTPAPKNTKDKIIGGLKKVRRTVLFVWRPALYARYTVWLVQYYRYFQTLGLKAPENLRKYYFLLSNTEMVRAYKPTLFKGSMVIFRSPNIYPDAHLGWSDFIDGEIITEDIQGHHLDRRQIMNEPFVQHTADKLTEYIELFSSKDY